MISRREWLEGSAAGSLLLSPLGRCLAAQATGAAEPPPPKRFVFVLFENGLWEHQAQPEGVGLGGDKVREIPLGPLTLPKKVIDPFTPYKDRLTILQGLRGNHLNPNHGSG